jgi:MFS transporter, FSR family, fosmidomycin resistance protein
MAITIEKNRIPFITAQHPAVTASLYGAAHLLVDLASVSTLYAAARSGLFSPVWAALLILSYDYIAFASQMFIGYALDRLRRAGMAAVAGCAVTAAGIWLTAAWPVAAVIAVALGNALFHVGGGAICLRLDRRRAIWPGIFVAPGAIGLFLGKQFGGTALFMPWALTLTLAAACLPSLLLREKRPRGAETPPFPRIKGFGLVAAALLLTVGIRSLVGYSVAYPWVKGWQQAIWLTIAVFAGKALGGALGDRVGWRKATIAGLLASAPLLAFSSGIPVLAVAGLLCFNLTMAITLAGISYMLPGHEGFAFGLTTTAIVVGLTPTVLPAWGAFLGSPYTLAGFILLSAGALWLALGRLEKALGRPENKRMEE